MGIREQRKDYYDKRKAEKEAMKAKIFEMRDAGYSRKEVAEQLGVSESTVRTYM